MMECGTEQQSQGKCCAEEGKGGLFCLTNHAVLGYCLDSVGLRVLLVKYREAVISPKLDSHEAWGKSYWIPLDVCISVKVKGFHAWYLGIFSLYLRHLSVIYGKLFLFPVLFLYLPRS
jgi:hypothetical protein